jgi:NADPH:quinone reductase-like Zn-dependent oxidoreductase
MISILLKNVFSKFPLRQFTAVANNEDLNTLSKLIKDGKVKPHIEKIYPYSKIPEAIGYIETMRTRGKVAMSWEL